MAFAVVLLAGGLSTGWLVEHTGASSIRAQKEIDLALIDTLNTVQKNSACPRDWAAVQAAASELFPMLHPELQFAEDKDPAVLAEEAARNWSLFNPAAEHARLLNDPAYREHFAAMEILIQTGVPQEIGN